ncbi:hypothetical protein [Azospirillum endophyticum]
MSGSSVGREATGASAGFLKSIRNAAQARIKSAVFTDTAASKAEIEQVGRAITAKPWPI